MNLNQVTIPSLNVESSVSFYKKLGLDVIVDALPNYARFECPNGDSTFSVHRVEKLPLGEGTYVYFECDDLDGRVQILIDKGITFEQMPEDKSWLWREARLTDPDGNKVILYYGGENRKNPPWRIDLKP